MILLRAEATLCPVAAYVKNITLELYFLKGQIGLHEPYFVQITTDDLSSCVQLKCHIWNFSLPSSSNIFFFFPLWEHLYLPNIYFAFIFRDYTYYT